MEPLLGAGPELPEGISGDHQYTIVVRSATWSVGLDHPTLRNSLEFGFGRTVTIIAPGANNDMVEPRDRLRIRIQARALSEMAARRPTEINLITSPCFA